MRIVIGVAGTAKNTGKTTTLLETTKFFESNGKDVFLTSIGYDGEDFDNITGLPKPRIFVPKGATVASALSLLESSPADFENLRYTGVDCALGPIYVGISRSTGKVVLAGPTNTEDLISVIEFAPLDCAVLLDGAFSRLSPMVAADSLILATGATRSSDPRKLAKEMNAIWRVMSLPKLPDTPIDRPGTGDSYEGTNAITLPNGLFLQGHGRKVGAHLADDGKQRTVYIRGIVNPGVFLEILEALGSSGSNTGDGHMPVLFVFDHPIMLLLSGEVILWERVLDRLSQVGCGVAVKDSTRLLGVTLNPYTLSQLDNGKFVAGKVDPRMFLGEVRNHAKAPCTDIVLEGPGILYSWLERYV
jgi:hypothetical protein